MPQQPPEPASNARRDDRVPEPHTRPLSPAGGTLKPGDPSSSCPHTPRGSCPPSAHLPQLLSAPLDPGLGGPCRPQLCLSSRPFQATGTSPGYSPRGGQRPRPQCVVRRRLSSRAGRTIRGCKKAPGAQGTKVRSGAGGRAGWGRKGVTRCRGWAPEPQGEAGTLSRQRGPRTAHLGSRRGTRTEGPWCLLLSVQPSACARPTAGVPATVLLFS